MLPLRSQGQDLAVTVSCLAYSLDSEQDLDLFRDAFGDGHGGCVIAILPYVVHGRRLDHAQLYSPVYGGAWREQGS